MVYLFIIRKKCSSAEVRPWKNAKVNIAKFLVKEKIIAFFPLKYLIDNFKNDQIDQFLASISFALDDDFSTPINPSKKNEYLFTQYIAEMVKSNCFDGIYYRSSVGKGINLVLFNKNKVEIQDSIELYEINSIAYSSTKKEIGRPPVFDIISKALDNVAKAKKEEV